MIIVGAGVFGLTAALELRRRRWAVRLTDPGPIPHPLAASTDVSKVVRLEYGSDEFYMAWAEEAREGWLRWNERWPEPLFHETGVLMLCRRAFAPGDFEAESFRLLTLRGHRPERLAPEAIARRFPAWNARLFQDGFYHSRGGYAESGRVIAALADEARRQGVEILEGAGVTRWVMRGPRLEGVELADGSRHRSDEIVLAVGAWSPGLVPELASLLRPVGQPVFHLRPADPTRFEASVFPVFTADVSKTGWYGFPLNRQGNVKLANHGPGRPTDPSGDRVVAETDEARLRVFLRETFPSLAEAPIVERRLCLYCDTPDGHFWIDRDPDRPGLTVAAGGSGHAFKFAPVLGPLIADVVEGRDHPLRSRFRWRPEAATVSAREAARFGGEPTPRQP